ncbi:hypothetical protein KDL01_06440 [Actinospica durhamensis]|uniref:Uncharacterized protein n=1 Tax=Actinospica durhamensis TaxID=1508375 RepID=A0A941EJU7_9ACTN|nr:hypothetical protein [Actinospica durhamensis]MBR7832892.1 hypothetical protein [Actinospica durhamensis]
MADGEEQRKLATALKDTIGGVAKDSSGKMAEFHEDTASIGEETSQALVDKDAGLAGDVTALHPDDAAPTVPKPTSAEADTASSTAAEDAASKEAADKAAAEEAARKAEKAAVPKRVAELRNQGHGPARHLDASDKQLEERLGKPVLQGNPPRTQLNSDGYVVSSKKIDPARPGAGGLADTDPLKYKDMYKTNAAGNPMNHSCGQYSTAFGDPESMVKADAAARAGIPAGAAGRQVVTVDAGTAIGADGVSGLRGKYIDPANPMTGTQVNYKDVNFGGAKITAVYDQDPASGDWNLTTIYPEPDKAVNP